MKRFFRSALVALTLNITGASSFAQTPIPPTTKYHAQNESHLVIREAINRLKHTKAILVKDTFPDPDGNRAEAVVLIEEAIEQLNLTLQSDKK
jgi:hypothetical protein